MIATIALIAAIVLLVLVLVGKPDQPPQKWLNAIFLILVIVELFLHTGYAARLN